jgi:hypothetical protein
MALLSARRRDACDFCYREIAVSAFSGMIAFPGQDLAATTRPLKSV